MSLYQFLTPLLALLIIVKIYSEFKRNKRSLRELITWTIVWWGIGFVGYAPDKIVEKVSFISGFESGINALIFFALVTLFYIGLRLFNSLDNLEIKVNKLIREIAIRDKETEQKSKNNKSK